MAISRKIFASINPEAEILDDGALGYFRGRFRNRLYRALMNVFLDAQAKGLTRASLARRLNRRPEQITRWFSGPGNLRLDTLSDLLLAMGHELEITVRPISQAHAEGEPVSAPKRVARG